MNTTRIVVDMIGRKVNVPVKPNRIISLVPSQTELLYDLGLTDEIVGQTIFCVHPDDMHQTKPRVGGTKKLNFEKIKALKPDLIIANKEENNKQDIEMLEKDYPVWVSNIVDLPSALEMILQVGVLVNKTKKSVQITTEISNTFKDLKSLPNYPKTLYLIWKNPYMAAGKDTFINYLLKISGFENIVLNHQSRYPEIDEEVIKQADVILLSSEPYPFKDKHIEELKRINPKSVVKLVDGELFSWYGSRLLYTAKYINSLVDELA
ncbi:MAG: ABC transporter substrate-binding protein [Bacteroidia bacterium]